MLNLNLRYRGQFLAIDGTAWRVDILQEGYQGAVGELTFEADEPLVIDWRETSKEEVICSSEATLRIESPGDRTYEDLYTIAPGEIRMDVFRKARGASEWQLYWRGLLDPEFYEEPYERARNYPVALTFSDFGILDRLKFGRMTGMQNLKGILLEAFTRSHLNYTLDCDTYCSLYFDRDSQMRALLEDILVSSTNFYDEDGDPCTLKETIEGILQPLGLKLIQRAGKIWVFDLNGLHAEASPRAIRWDGNSQTMGADKVYNNIKVTWSPYVKDGNLGEEECFVKGTDPNIVALNKDIGQHSGDCQVFSYHSSTDVDEWSDGTDSGFSLWTATEGKNATLQNSGLRFFKIVPQNDGAAAEGVAIRWPGVAQPVSGSSDPSCLIYGAALPSGWQGQPGWINGYLGGPVRSVLWKSADIQLPPVHDPSYLRLHITLEMLMDCRFNPFEEAADMGSWKQKEWHDKWRSKGNYVYVPVSIKFKPSGSDTVYCWRNIGTNIMARPVDHPLRSLDATLGSWETYDTATDNNPSDFGYLAWYSASDRDGDTGVLGWQPNRPAINPHIERLATAMANLGTGQWIPMPPNVEGGGTLTIEVRQGNWLLSDGGQDLSHEEFVDPSDLWTNIDPLRTPWCLMKLPQVEVRKAQAYDNELDTDDVEYRAVINEHAREDLELQTICGTAEGGVAMARGAYWRGTTQIEQMTRAGRTATVEQLLIGTLYSQFATRHTTLEGETAIDPGGLTTYTERNQGTKRFMMLSERQDVRMGTADCLYCELSADQYDRYEQQ